MADRSRVRSHTRQINGRTVHVREHERRGVGAAGAIAAVGVGALLAGVAAPVVAAGAAVALPVWAAHRWPDETRVARVGLRRAAQRSQPVLRRARQAAVARGREALQRRERRCEFQRRVLDPLDRLRAHPELLALAVDNLADGQPPEDALAYASQAEAAIRRAGRKRELAARARAVRRVVRGINKRLRVEADYAEAFFARAYRAPAGAWVSRRQGSVWSARDLRRATVARHAKRARRRGQPVLPEATEAGLARLEHAAQLDALGQLAVGRVSKQASETLQSLWDELLRWDRAAPDPAPERAATSADARGER